MKALALLIWLCGISLPLHAAVETPAKYVVGAFEKRDIVFLGEPHLVKNNLEFLAGLIPALHAAGVRNLGWEFASSEDQPLIDRLLSGETYDKELAYAIILGWRQPGNVFAYEEYAAVYRAAWALNRSLPAGAQPFRIVALDVPGDRPGVSLSSGSTVRRPASWIDVNVHWAQVIQRAFVDPGLKALVYCGSGHTTTRFYNWRKPQDWDFGGVPRIITAGNLVYHNVGLRAARILLHGAEGGGGEGRDEFSVLRDIERVAMQSFTRDGSFGMDLAGTKLGAVPIPRAGFVDGKSAGFTLSDVADGYVFLGPVSQWLPVTPLRDFVTPTNRWMVQSLLPGYRSGEAEKSIAEINAVLAGAATKAVP